MNGSDRRDSGGHDGDPTPRYRNPEQPDGAPRGWRRETAAPIYLEPDQPISRRERGRRRRAESARRRRRGGAVLLAVIVLIAAVGVGAWFIVREVSPPDYDGPGGAETLVQIQPGASTTAIAGELEDAGVVKSAKAFLRAAKGNEAISGIHPGYYELPTEIPAADAVTALAGGARVGHVVVPEGRQLFDVTTVAGNRTDGILSIVSQASCLTVDGAESCVDREELVAALADLDPGVSGIPEWAVERVRQVTDPVRRYEGLIMAGSFDVDPRLDAREMLVSLFEDSAAGFEARGLGAAPPTSELSPYDTLIAASLIEREAPPEDFDKVARVIVNRLAEDQMLQFDSTVNYLLETQETATTDEDRARSTPWNTYAMFGMPATPISAPGDAAIDAAEHPADGDWLYFVTIDHDGTTLFTHDYDEHLENITLAQEAGVLDSGR